MLLKQKSIERKTVHAFLPRLSSKLGHIFHYHAALEKALQNNEWSYIAYIPEQADLISLPQNWKKVLANDLSDSSKTFFQKLKLLFASIWPYRKIFQTLANDNSAIVFLEHFELPHLAALALALLFLRPKFQFWILFRYEFGRKRDKALLCRLFLRYMGWKLDVVKCLTDSDLLAQVLEKDLRRPIFIMPIPHTDLKEPVSKKEVHEKTLFWWPGGLIREDKGLSQIQSFLKLMKNRDGLQLILAEKAQGILGNHPSIQYIPTYLSRDEYIKWMQTVEIVLLPYSAIDYARRTSGIFVEAIVLGAMPIVTKETWMAYELSKFHLTELTFDWTEKNLLDCFDNILKDKILRRKLDAMRDHYRTFHTQEGIAAAFESLIKNSEREKNKTTIKS